MIFSNPEQRVVLTAGLCCLIAYARFSSELIIVDELIIYTPIHFSPYLIAIVL